MPTPPLISLCLITGNAEDYIERCLRSFAPIADELVLVRAIGAQTPDRTVEIAAAIAAELELPFLSTDYLNAPAHADWLHVDDFAAARNESFRLAHGRYCFWCDTDDELLSGAELIREHAERYEYACHIFPYLIQPLGVRVPRERLLLRGYGQWRYPVHECYRFPIDPVAACQDERIVVVHRPHTSKSGSNERNLTILRSIPAEEMNAGLYYHLHGELLGLGDLPGAIEAYQQAHATGDLGKAERYEMLLNLARSTPDPGQREALLHQAYQCDPQRREALAVLAGNAMDHGRPDLGLTYALQMRATPRPENTEWNQRESFYGWIGDDVFEQALRASGHIDGADSFRRQRLGRHGGPLIALLHATRGRPQMAVNTRKFWLDYADHPERIEHLFIFDADDADSHALTRLHHLIVPPGGGCVRAWNAGVAATEAPVLVQLSDDFLPFAGWDTAILERLGYTAALEALPKTYWIEHKHPFAVPSVLAVSDGLRTDRLLCMAICTRAHVQRQGYLFHPDFKSVYSDDWFTHEAYRLGVVIEARDLVFEHRHPIKTGAPLDRTYAEQNAPERYQEGAAVLTRLMDETGYLKHIERLPDA